MYCHHVSDAISYIPYEEPVATIFLLMQCVIFGFWVG